MSADCVFEDTVAVVSSYLSEREGGSVAVILLIVTRQLVVM